MRLRFGFYALLASVGALAMPACGSDSSDGGGASTDPCPTLSPSFRFPNGATGHADPFGAKAAGQARAGKITSAAQIVQAANARHRVRIGDFAIANDKIALYIESEKRPSGYAPFGGDLLAIEPVGDDGKPKGVSVYNETLFALSRQVVNPDLVSVLADGSDGKAAVVRVAGVLTNVPFLDTFRGISPQEYDIPAALDYVLEPGAEKALVRISLANTTFDSIDFTGKQRFGFFQSSRSKLFTDKAGYGPAGTGDHAWVAWDGGEHGFALRAVGRPVQPDLEISGFQLVYARGLGIDACTTSTTDYFELLGGGPGIDGLLEANRRAYGEAAWREVKGTLTETGGGPLAGAFIHATAADGSYLTRTKTATDGTFTLHLPPGSAGLTPTLPGWALPAATSIADGATQASLTLPARASIAIDATDAATKEPIPVRVQVIPAVAPKAAPASFGLREELDGRLWQEFAVTGKATLPVPPGQHRVIVSRGYEYEISDTTVTAEVGKTASVVASLVHSVDSTGVMCADFHVHAEYSADAADPAEEKIKATIADGVEIPVSSEHEWVFDPSPIVKKLGMTKWAYGLPSSELTTFSWGHFGVVPIVPHVDAYNNGAVLWVGKQPADIFAQVAALPEKPVLVVNHPSTSQAFFSYFTAASFDRQSAKGDPALWSEGFGAVEVWNDSDFDANRATSVGDWFALLDAGHSFWGVGNSDSHDRRKTFVGYPRNCMTFGHDDPTKLTPETVRDVLRSGASNVSGGLFMTVKSPTGGGPGTTSKAGKYEIVVQSPSWFAADSLEVIVDGTTTSTVALTADPTVTPGRRYAASIDVAAASSRPRHWVVFHAKGGGDLAPIHPGKKPFAVSNPIFF